MIEKEIENYFKKQLELWNIYYIKNHGNNFTKVGIPDLIFCFKGKYIAVEFKKLPNKPSEAQKMNLSQIYLNDGIIMVVDERNYKEVVKLFNPFLTSDKIDENWKTIVSISTECYKSLISER